MGEYATQPIDVDPLRTYVPDADELLTGLISGSKSDQESHEAINRALRRYRQFVQRMETVRPHTGELREVHRLYLDALQIQLAALDDLREAAKERKVPLALLASSELRRSKTLLARYIGQLTSPGRRYNVPLPFLEERK